MFLLNLDLIMITGTLVEAFSPGELGCIAYPPNWLQGPECQGGRLLALSLSQEGHAGGGLQLRRTWVYSAFAKLFTEARVQGGRLLAFSVSVRARW